VEVVLAVIVGLAFGSALAAAAAFPLRRRLRKGQSGRIERTRRIPLESGDARHRASIVAAGFAMIATVAQLAGWTIIAAYFMLGVVFLAVQVATSALAVRNRRP
jgi:heme O synthase-like polyprenyltransferase